MTWPSKLEEYQRLAEALRELVGGRRDVVARYFAFMDGDRVVKGWSPWGGKRVGKDYEPAPGELVHAKKDYKTNQLVRQVLRPMSVETLLEHLRGRERLGVYVLDHESRCSFLAADFDDHAGTLDADAVWAEVHRFWETCEINGWRAHIERSKSGKGYHVWIFFGAPVPAGKARAIGRWLMEESQTIREGEDFSTFDRFFPAQARLQAHAKGFGNLIGMPLSGPKDYQAGRCAWVDPATRETIPAAYTHTIGIVATGRNPAAAVDAFMAEWSLQEETAAGEAGSDYVPRDPNQDLGTGEELSAAVERCAFLAWASEPNNQKSVKEPLWYALVSNACRFDADDWVHKASENHPGYSYIETQIKIDHARSSSGPHKCKTIKDNGFLHCPEGGCALPNGQPTAAPAGLAAWAKPKEQKAKGRGNRGVSMRREDMPPQEPGWDEGAVPLDEDSGQPWPSIYGPFDVSNDGVHHRTTTKDGDVRMEVIALRPLWVHAITESTHGLAGVYLRFFDLRWRMHSHALPRSRLYEQGGMLGRELADLGFPIVPGKEKYVSRYIVSQETESPRIIRSSGRLGWYDAVGAGAVFVMPDQVIGKSQDEIVFQPDSYTPAAETLHQKGSLTDWQRDVVEQVRGNPILMFALMNALAGPLLKPCQEQSGGWHLYGTTTMGKTTAAQVGASVWGCGADPQEGPEATAIRKWYATGNALESIAELHNDTVLALDEIGEVDAQELGRIIYQLAGGLSKSRANAGGGLRQQRTWRLLFWSTGEKSVRQVLSQVGQEPKGGQLVRMPDIPASDATGTRTIVMDPKGKDPKDYTQDLKAACARAYGLAGPVFVAYLIARAEAHGWHAYSARLRQELRRLEDRLCEGVGKMPPEGRRVVRRLALVALAGWHASDGIAGGTKTGDGAGLLPWPLEEILAAVADIRDRWLSEQGEQRSETDRGLAHLRDEIMANLDRIRPVDHDGQGYRNVLGFRTQDHFLFSERGMRELCGEFDVRSLLHALRDKGFLWHDSGRLTKKSPIIKGFADARPNLYWIKMDVIGEREQPRLGQAVGTRELGEDDSIPF